MNDFTPHLKTPLSEGRYVQARNIEYMILRAPGIPPQVVLFLLVVGMSLHLLWLLIGGPASAWRSGIANLSYLPIYFLSAWLAFSAARRHPLVSSFWRWIGYGLTSWGIASGVYFVIDSVLHLNVFPSLADLFYLICLPCFALGLLNLRREAQGRLNRLSILLDVFVVVLAVGEVLWTTSVASTIEIYKGQPFNLTIALLYPGIDLVLCAGMVTLALWRPLDLTRTELLLLAAGMGSLLMTNVIYAQQVGLDTYRSGTILDSGWTLGAALCGWAAYLSSQTRQQATRLSLKISTLLNRWLPLLPHYAVLGTFSIYLVFQLLNPAPTPVQSAVVLAITALFTLRQGLVLAQNQSLQSTLAHRAEHDPLTGVRNRNNLDLRLQYLIDSNHAVHQQAAVLFVDLDRMKLINDTFGHPVGDLVLREVAARLTSDAGGANDVTRFGGDEFVMILPELQHSTEAAVMAQQILDALTQPIQVAGETVNLTASIGIALIPGDATTAAQAIEKSDTAMYEAKHDGKNSWRFADAALNSTHVPQANIEIQLRGALERGEFALHFQPLVSLDTGDVEGFEALLRWYSPVLGQVSPATFIPVAESREMMGGIGRWVLRAALKEARSWRAGALPNCHVAVNVSAAQLDAPDFVADVMAALQDCALMPSALTLELTESAVLANVDSARGKMMQLKALGVRIALDDFGMGFSSLGQLRHLPVDVLKIDRVFVKELQKDDAAFVRAIVALGHSLNLAVVAEGIEDAETAHRLRVLGCDVGQGFYFGKPMNAPEALTAILAAGSWERPRLNLKLKS
ncbi:putative bifunctional diguanylate cyclase/phosphodiesterase [Deinococcus alpinitundrae]|uniref:putative bifunctional diguanylate cyclase/phosphodiesterase n=1 Tax=Deinococcus alpinitundrae TaxID=468913 RepID=UPI00137B08A4|nr:EAL domain-containing protein [Deinococcus alpinitundrae]